MLLVVIDGLRADVAGTLPFLSRLGDAGGRAATWDDPPTYSAAQYVALLAGVPPRDSGVRTNETLRAAGVDDVARRARAAGLHTAVVSTCVDWWRRLFPESFESADVVASSGVVAEVARLRTRGGLLVVHLCGVDDAGHAHGARSPEYAAAAAAADRMTAALADAWGWPRADVVVTADHGHRDRGGHGGDEPEVRASFVVAAGPDVQPGARVDDARSVDLAPTLAALLDVAPPGAASGRTLVDFLRVPPARREALVAADAERRARVSAAGRGGARTRRGRRAPRPDRPGDRGRLAGGAAGRAPPSAAACVRARAGRARGDDRDLHLAVWAAVVQRRAEGLRLGGGARGDRVRGDGDRARARRAPSRGPARHDRDGRGARRCRRSPHSSGRACSRRASTANRRGSRPGRPGPTRSSPRRAGRRRRGAC